MHGFRRSSRSQRTYALIGELGAFSPGLKPGRWKIKRSRGFENPLPRTESPGLAQLGTDHSAACHKLWILRVAAFVPGFENVETPSRTESPGLAQLGTDHAVACHELVLRVRCPPLGFECRNSRAEDLSPAQMQCHHRGLQAPGGMVRNRKCWSALRTKAQVAVSVAVALWGARI